MVCLQHQYFLGSGCHQCLLCPPGQELTEDCGYGEGERALCAPCGARWYKQAWGYHGCQLCQACHRVNRHQVSVCSPTSNAVCGDCLPGFYSKRRLDGLQDVECMPCGPAPFRDLQCSRSGDGVEKVWSSEAPPQSIAVTVCVVATFAMVMLLSVAIVTNRRRTSLRKLFRGCLTPHSNSRHDTEAASLSMVTQHTLTQEVEEQASGPVALRVTLQGGAFPVSTTITSDLQRCDLGCLSETQRLVSSSVCSQGSSGVISQDTSDPASPPHAWLSAPEPCACVADTRACVANVRVCVADVCVGRAATGGRHCASEQQQQQQHAPVECTELDFHCCSTLEPRTPTPPPPHPARESQTSTDTAPRLGLYQLNTPLALGLQTFTPPQLHTPTHPAPCLALYHTSTLRPALQHTDLELDLYGSLTSGGGTVGERGEGGQPGTGQDP